MSTLIIADNDLDGYASASLLELVLASDDALHFQHGADEFKLARIYRQIVIADLALTKERVDQFAELIDDENGKRSPNNLEYVLWIDHHHFDSAEYNRLKEICERKGIAFESLLDTSVCSTKLCSSALSEETRSKIANAIKGIEFINAFDCYRTDRDENFKIGQLINDHFQETYSIAESIKGHCGNTQAYTAFDQFMRKVAYGLMQLSGLMASEAEEKGYGHPLEHMQLSDIDMMFCSSLPTGLVNSLNLPIEEPIVNWGHRQAMCRVISEVYRKLSWHDPKVYYFEDQAGTRRGIWVIDQGPESPMIPYLLNSDSGADIIACVGQNARVELRLCNNETDIDLSKITASLGSTGGHTYASGFNLKSSKAPSEQDDPETYRKKLADLGAFLANLFEFHA